MQPVVVVHGGAGAYTLVGLSGITIQNIRDGVLEAARAAHLVLAAHGSAVDAVQAAVVSMEDNPTFNAGVGSYFTREKTIEMDTCIMDGSSLNTGAACSICNVANPVKVARVVMDQTEHNLFAGEAAKSLAQEHGFELVPTESLTTEKSLTRIREYIAAHRPNPVVLETRNPDEHDTVGAVALDYHGNVAAASSTGGITGKMCGRVGDAAIIGAGIYADNNSGAVVSTGCGEAMMRVCTCKHAAMLMEQGISPQDAMDQTLEMTLTRGRGDGGCVAVNSRGDIGVSFNTKGMAWASIQGDVAFQGMNREERIAVNV